MRLILSARRRVRWRSRTPPVKGCWPLTPLAENLAHHIVSADGQFSAVDATLVPKAEDIARHIFFDGNS